MDDDPTYWRDGDEHVKLAAYVPGLIPREAVVSATGRLLADHAAPVELADTVTAVDIEGWRIPKDRRPACNALVRRLKHRYRRPVVLMRVSRAVK